MSTVQESVHRNPVDGFTVGTGMFEMSALDVVLLAVAGYLAVITLVRLMRRRREGIIEDLTKQIELEQQRLKEDRKKEKRRLMQEQMKQEHQRMREERRSAS